MEIRLSTHNRDTLRDALGEAQRIGMLGAGDLDAVIDRSLGFVRQLPEHTRQVIDLGSGGGDPGLVIAASCPDLSMTMVDRRAKRTDLLVRLVGRMGLSSRIEVVEADVADLARIFPSRVWDAATSRGFGSPAYTAEHAAPLIEHGCLLVSEPPDSTGERWTVAEVRSAGFVLESVRFGVARLMKTYR
jgi:16S rRNA (guanine527-N7)-methyltransferase